VNTLTAQSGRFFVFWAGILLLASCGLNRTEPGTTAEPHQNVEFFGKTSKVDFPVSASLDLSAVPEPGGIADITLSLESSLPEPCTVEIELRLPESLRLAKGEASFQRNLHPRAPDKVPIQIRIPDERRYVVEALVSIPNPEGLPATIGSALVIDLGKVEKTGKEPVILRAPDGRSLNVTVTE
jgi:hypothetical protein